MEPEAGPPPEAQVTLRLMTRLGRAFRVPPGVLAVPSRLTRFGLSEVVNSLLQLGTQTRRGEARRMSERERE